MIVLPIAFRHGIDGLFYLVAEMLWMKHLIVSSVREDFLFKIESQLDVALKGGEVLGVIFLPVWMGFTPVFLNLVGGQFVLRRMHGKAAEIVGLPPVHIDYQMLRLRFLAVYDAVALAEERCTIEAVVLVAVGVKLECRVKLFHLAHSVKCIGAQHSVISSGNQIPTLIERLEEVWLDIFSKVFVLPEGMVVVLHSVVVLHGDEQRFDVVPSSRQRFADDAVVECLVFADEIVH